jgi:AraC family transcriptional regulator
MPFGFELQKVGDRLSVLCFGVKYVASGEEIYYANGKKYNVKVGEYIIGNEFTKSLVQINSSESVQGLCIDISSEIISEVAEFFMM